MTCKLSLHFFSFMNNPLKRQVEHRVNANYPHVSGQEHVIKSFKSFAYIYKAKRAKRRAELSQHFF